ncbi:MAG: hypothetical protein KBD37_07085 [Burkholderiales bacterium]|nr:hypothetical protein [Burkholderiales bacterium]
MAKLAKYWGIILLIILLSGLYSWILFDKAGDGRWYHQETIILVKNGWNPLYSPFNLDTVYDQFHQTKTFPIASELLAASFSMAFSHIQVGKIINILFALYCSSITFMALNQLCNLNLKSNLIITLYITLNPIALSQLQSFYIDGNLLYCFTILLFSTLGYVFGNIPSSTSTSSQNIQFKYNNYNMSISKNMHYFWLINTIISFILLANLKFTGLVFSCIIILIPTIIHWCIYNKLPKSYLGLIFWLIIGILYFGWHPYIQNLIYQRNILWPIMGNHTDHVFNEVSGYVKLPKLLLFIISYFTPYPMEADNLFVPSIKPFVRTDTALGALGPFFGIIMLTSIYWSIKYFWSNLNNLKNDKMVQILLSMTIILIITIAMNPALSWAKYSPQIVLLPSIGLIIFYLHNNKHRKFTPFLIFMIVINSGLFYGGSLVLTAYRSYKFYKMESYCKANQCIFDIQPGRLFYVSLLNQLLEDHIPINKIGSCSRQKIIWTDVQQAGVAPQQVCSPL